MMLIMRAQSDSAFILSMPMHVQAMPWHAMPCPLKVATMSEILLVCLHMPCLMQNGCMHAI